MKNGGYELRMRGKLRCIAFLLTWIISITMFDVTAMVSVLQPVDNQVME
jgi:hypothetical protein